MPNGMGHLPHRKGSLLAAAAAVGLAVALSACGTEPDPIAPVPDPAAGSAPPATGTPPAEPAGGEPRIASPADGDTVTVPFEVTVEAGVELGAIADELHHMHIWFDDTQASPSVIESDTATVGTAEIPAPEGETTLWMQIHTFEHGPVSDPVSISLTVDGGDIGY